MTVTAPHLYRRFRPKPHVVVVGGGAAGLEACLALRHDGGPRITLVEPNAELVHRPPRAGDPLVRLPVARVAEHAGATLLRDRVTDLDADRRRVHTRGGGELAYDALLLATGAIGQLPVARTAGGRWLFIAPPDPIWRLEWYELALQTAAASLGRDVVLVTTEERPLECLGLRAAPLVAATLLVAGVDVRTSAYARTITEAGVHLWPSGEFVEGAASVAPTLAGRVPSGVPADAGGFAETDPFGRVAGLEHVYAAGDCTAFPLKHASLAAAQADAAAATICGAPAPFEPMLRWVLPGSPHWYVEAPIAGGKGEATRLTTKPLWPASARFGSRHLSALLGAARMPPRPRRDEEIEPIRHALRRFGARRR